MKFDRFLLWERQDGGPKGKERDPSNASKLSLGIFQDLREDVYLLELESKEDAEVLVNNGFDIEEFHVDCSPPHGKFFNVSIMVFVPMWRMKW